MRYPSIKTIETRLNLDQETATKVRGLIDGSIDPETVPETVAWIDQCYHRPSDYGLIMHAIDAVLENYGVCRLNSRYRFSNTGDTYAPTVILDNETGRFLITSWGDLVESGKVRED
jgi:hypothetical protein